MTFLLYYPQDLEKSLLQLCSRNIEYSIGYWTLPILNSDILASLVAIFYADVSRKLIINDIPFEHIYLAVVIKRFLAPHKRVGYARLGGIGY